MKLYATTTSERASKGQGGNQHVLIVLTAEIDGERQEIASMSAVVTENDTYRFNVATPDGQARSIEIARTTKGKSQKGEYDCQNCGKEMPEHTEDMKNTFCYDCYNKDI